MLLRRFGQLSLVTIFFTICGSVGPAGQNRLIHTNGQTVTPSFEGWFKNADGTYNLVFGYYNRNKVEEMDVPVGPNNKLSPGSIDRGQPTHFLTGRRVGVFSVTVPKDFGNQTVTWTLTTEGQSLAIPGHIRPDFEISAMKELTTGNVPPVIRLDPEAKGVQGPVGATLTRTAAVGEKVNLNVWADPAPQGETDTDTEAINTSRILAISRYRGADALKIEKSQLRLTDGNPVSTQATFSEAGEYTLAIVAGRPGTTGCCWTNLFLRVVVR